MSMFIPFCRLCAMILSASLVSGAHASGPGGASHSDGPPPLILSTVVDGAQHRLLIAGAHFGQRPPTVTLGGRALPVLRSSATAIVASLPAGLRPATYLLRIGDTANLARADTFSLSVPIARTASAEESSR